MKKLIYLILFLPIYLIGQDKVEPEALSSAGDRFEVSNLKLDWTLGENPVETIGSGDNNLTQGFQQGELNYTTSVIIIDPQYAFKVFPNPVSLKLTISGEVSHSTHAKLIDMEGRIISTKLIENNHTEMDVSQLASGIYLVGIFVENISVQWIKINKN